MENIVKGKRTKRQRIQYSPPPALMVADSSSGSSADQEASMSPTEEEEDMANCLILLAQGRGGVEVETKPDLEDKFRSKRIVDQSGGNFVYECKTCSRCFPSFQALGGHRASHKKPRLAAAVATAEERKVEIGEDMLQISMNSSFSRSTNNSSMIKPRVHECSICGSEFNSGQALGGHMRRHRPLVVAENQEVVIKKERSLLELDLNLPAPSSDDDELQRPSPSPTFELPLLFSASASALVDCHY